MRRTPQTRNAFLRVLCFAAVMSFIAMTMFAAFNRASSRVHVLRTVADRRSANTVHAFQTKSPVALEKNGGRTDRGKRGQHDTALIVKLKTLRDTDNCLLSRFTSLFDVVEMLRWDVVLMYNEGEELGKKVLQEIARRDRISSVAMPKLPSSWNRFGIRPGTFVKTKWGATLWFSRSQYRHLW